MTIYKKRTIRRKNNENEGKMYIEYNPNYRPKDFSISSNKKPKPTKEQRQATTDKLNKLLRRNI